MTPDQYTNQELFMDVGSGHRIYVHDWGNAKAKTPIIYLHGGPGNGCSDRDKKKYDPKTQRVVFHDQRGSGNSTPIATYQNNTTQELVEDIEKILKQLNLDKVILTGGSWGSCLALAFGINYPRRVKAMVLNGIFTGTKEEIDWIGKGGYKVFFPEVWEEYCQSVPKAARKDPTSYHLKQAFGKDPIEAKKSAYAYERAELAVLKLDDTFTPDSFENYDHSTILVEMYFIANSCFMPDKFILNNASKLTMPIWLVQGRYDMVCPPITAEKLDKSLPNSHLIWTINGHLGQHESNTIQQLLRVLETEKV